MPRFMTEVMGRVTHPKWAEYTNVDDWDEAELIALIASDNMDREDLITAVGVHIKPTLISNFNAHSLGTLGALSLEMLNQICDDMDFLTLGTLSLTCRAARVIFLNHPTMRLLIKHVANIPRILFFTGLTQWISIRNLKAELQFPLCRSCGALGTCLFLPTCERLCQTCLELNISYWCIPPIDAKQAFALENEDLQTLPVVRIHERQFATRWPFNWGTMKTLIPTKCAWKASVKKYGSAEDATHAAERISPDIYEDACAAERHEAMVYRLLRQAQPTPEANPILPLLYQTDPEHPKISATALTAAAVLYPFVERTSSEPTTFYLCKGCNYPFEEQLDLCPDVLQILGFHPASCPDSAANILRYRGRFARTQEQMLEHAKDCIGCGIIMWDDQATFAEISSI